MRIVPGSITGVYLVEIEPIRDERGSFARLYCRDAFRAHGIELAPPQINTAFNARRGTLRGMHFQEAPFEEAKLVCCLKGTIFDVIVDLRPGSATASQWMKAELDGTDRRAFYVPPGCAHGYLTLTEETEVLYLMGAPHEPTAARGVRWDDPAFSIDWPFDPLVISDRDRAWPDWEGGRR